MLLIRPLLRFAVLILFLTFVLPVALLAQWRSLGPEGGDARAFGVDPANAQHILLGTSDGNLLSSEDGGRSWKPLAHLGDNYDYVLDHIVFLPGDSQTIYAAAWSVERHNGDLFVTHDGGAHWQAIAGVHGKSIRSFAIAPTDPKILTIGALDGVFRSHDSGENWQKITPEGHPDLKNIESLAVDAADPDTIYAGTWHLPWKSSDGGKSWVNIKQGFIDDSDIFSIIIDHTNRQNVYISACSGIFKSENAASLFHKIQGIPGTARRTRILHQDPVSALTVYAGTTEGLWRTVDGGKKFQLISPPNFILNDIHVDPANNKRLLIATDRGGVFSSDDGGASWQPANRGFSHRQVTSAVSGGSKLYISVVNDKEFGGVFRSVDNGANWQPWNKGIEELEIFGLSFSPAGILAAATNRGIFILQDETGQWKISNTILRPEIAPPPPRHSRNRPAAGTILWKRATMNSSVRALLSGEDLWLAATSQGIYFSRDEGHSWLSAAISNSNGNEDFLALAQQGSTAAAITRTRLALSQDSGVSWRWAELPPWHGTLNEVALDHDSVWLATSDGLLHSRDSGQHWELVVRAVPEGEALSIRSTHGILLLTVRSSQSLYVSRDGGLSWLASAPSGYPLSWAENTGQQFVAATGFDGLLLLEKGL